MSPTAEPILPAPAQDKPRAALAIATIFGVGFLRPGPGTWGSVAGLILTWYSSQVLFPGMYSGYGTSQGGSADLSVSWPLFINLVLAVAVALIGVWAANVVEKLLGEKDPQIVVIDEVSGQQLTLLLGAAWLVPVSRLIEFAHRRSPSALGLSLVNWKYFLLGFILFRVFDIWKPFPARQAERLPGGWGIMADDWIAAIYAAIGLWSLRALGL